MGTLNRSHSRFFLSIRQEIGARKSHISPISTGAGSYTCVNGHLCGRCCILEASKVDLILGILRTLLMIGSVGLIIGGLAALFMIVFAIATSIDRKMQQ